MPLRFSKALANFLNHGGSLRQALSYGKIDFRTGAQPATADAAPTGTLLCTFTRAGAAHTPEVKSTGTITLTGGGSGNFTSVKVAGLEVLNGTTTFNTSLTQTAADLAAAIKRNVQNCLVDATSSSTVVTLSGRPGLGANPNTLVLAGTTATITATFGTMTGGTNPANGLNFELSTTGTMTKIGTDTWSGTGVSDGTAGWFRWKAAVADADALDSAEAILRLDGAIATSGGQLNGSSTAITTGAVQTITSDQLLLAMT